jgi:hypothetical protein
VISDERAAKRRTLRGRGVFRLAETVPHTWRGEGQECELLKVGVVWAARCVCGARSARVTGTNTNVDWGVA